MTDCTTPEEGELPGAANGGVASRSPSPVRDTEKREEYVPPSNYGGGAPAARRARFEQRTPVRRRDDARAEETERKRRRVSPEPSPRGAQYDEGARRDDSRAVGRVRQERGRSPRRRSTTRSASPMPRRFVVLNPSNEAMKRELTFVYNSVLSAHDLLRDGHKDTCASTLQNALGVLYDVLGKM